MPFTKDTYTCTVMHRAYLKVIGLVIVHVESTIELTVSTDR